MTHLQEGDKAPDFRSTTQDGEPLTLADLAGQRTILYFYPKDNTSGCTLEAKSLRDGREELARMGFRIIGRDETDGMGKPYPILHLQLPEAENGNK